jgi:sugar phosphate isomerase/epimerase
MIYVSTGGRYSHTAFETAKDFLDHGITSIELSGGIYSASYKKKLLSLSNKATFQVHNYFPPPLVPFVLNLASQNSDILNQSINHTRKAMDLVSALGGGVYSFHAGYRFDPKVSDLGKSLSKSILYNREKALKIFKETVLMLSEEAKKKGINLLIENNVINRYNLNKFGEDPLLLTNPIEIIEFMKGMPSNVGILLDVAHLKVSSNSLGFNLLDAAEQIHPWVQGYHLSDNDGKSDSNQLITSNSWFWKILDKSKTYYSIEVYGVNTIQLLDQYNLVLEKIKHV